MAKTYIRLKTPGGHKIPGRWHVLMPDGHTRCSGRSQDKNTTYHITQGHPDVELSDVPKDVEDTCRHCLDLKSPEMLKKATKNRREFYDMLSTVYRVRYGSGDDY